MCSGELFACFGDYLLPVHGGVGAYPIVALPSYALLGIQVIVRSSSRVADCSRECGVFS